MADTSERGRPRRRSRSRAPVRRLLDRVVAGVAWLLARGFFRRVEVTGRDRIPRDRPVLVVANHFNGFVDPVLVVAALGRLPRFLAKATLWKVWPARPFLALAGVVPVFRAADGATAGNVSTFHRCHDILARGGTVAIFPEGTTHDMASLAPVRTGAARIALGAVAAGVDDLVILPVGLAFEDKLAMRSRVAVRVGRPLETRTVLPEVVPRGEVVGEENHDGVQRLTGRIEDELRAVAPDFVSVEERGALELAAEIALRTEDGHRETVSLAARGDVARALAARPPDERSVVVERVARYNLDLTLARLDDRALAGTYRPRALVARLLRRGVVAVVLAPLALTGLVVNVLPWLATRLASRAVATPVTRGTVRILVGAVAFTAAWVGFALATADTWPAHLAWIGIYAAAGFALVYVTEAVVHVLGDLRGWQTSRDRRALVEPLRARRAEVVATVGGAEALVPGPRPPTAAAPATSPSSVADPS